MTKDWAKDTIHANIEVHFGWWDRVRVLFGKAARVEVAIDCENEVGKTWSISRVSVDPFLRGPYRRDRGADVVESPPDLTAYS